MKIAKWTQVGNKMQPRVCKCHSFSPEFEIGQYSADSQRDS